MQGIFLLSLKILLGILLLPIAILLGIQLTGEFLHLTHDSHYLATTHALLFNPIRSDNKPRVPPEQEFHANQYRGWYNPYQNLKARWLKTNFHAHSSRFEGADSPQTLAENYHSRKYEVFAISDHMLITRPKELPKELLFIPAYEHGANIRKLHFTVINPSEFSWDWFPVWQGLARRKTMAGMLQSTSDFLVLNHPLCPGVFMTSEELAQLTEIDAIEITSQWNCNKSERGTLRLWDETLQRGRRIWAFGGDDTHDLKKSTGDGYLLVHASKDQSSVIEALRAGRFVVAEGEDDFHAPLPGRITLDEHGLFISLDKTVDRLSVILPGVGTLSENKDRRELHVPWSSLSTMPYLRIQYATGYRRYYTNVLYQIGALK